MGVTYYDFTYAKPELLQLQPCDFYDNQHLNAVGCLLYTSQLLAR